MARKLPLAEWSVVVDGPMELAASLANSGYRGEWHATTFEDTLLALAGRLLPDGTVLDQPCSNWSRVFAENQVFPAAESGVKPDGLTPSRGDHWLVIGSADEVAAWLNRGEQLLRDKQLGWLTVYTGNGEVRQWNRAALRRWFAI